MTNHAGTGIAGARGVGLRGVYVGVGVASRRAVGVGVRVGWSRGVGVSRDSGSYLEPCSL